MDELYSAIRKVVEDAEAAPTTNEIVRQLRDGWDAAEILKGLTHLTREGLLEIDFVDSGARLYVVVFKPGPKAEPLPYVGTLLGVKRR